MIAVTEQEAPFPFPTPHFPHTSLPTGFLAFLARTVWRLALQRVLSDLQRTAYLEAGGREGSELEFVERRLP